MLQGSRERAAVEAEEWAEEAKASALGSLGGSRFIIVSYLGCCEARAAATVMYWFLRSIGSAGRFELHSGEALAYHVLAYRRVGEEEPPTVVVFASSGCENRLVRLLDAAAATGARVGFVAAPSVPAVVRGRLEALGREPLMLEYGGLRLAPLMLAAKVGLEAASRLIEDAGGVEHLRVRRLRGEVSSLSAVASELVERFASTAREAVGGGYLAYTPTMAAAAYYASGIQPALVVEPVSSLISRLASGGELPGRPGLVATTVEEDAVREATFKASVRGLRLPVLTLPTDPLTAPVYAAMLMELACR